MCPDQMKTNPKGGLEDPKRDTLSSQREEDLEV